MLSIGLTRWWLTTEARPLPRGELGIILALTPQAVCYRLADHDVFSRSFAMTRRIMQTDPLGVRARTAYQAADQLAHEVVRWCEARGLVRGQIMEQSEQLRHAILGYVQQGESEEPEPQIGIINISVMEATLEGMRHGSQRDAEAHGRVGYAARRKKVIEAEQRAFELLLKWLTPEEKEEAGVKGRITIRNRLGKFVVPVTRGMVERYVDGKLEAEYCVVFKDSALPTADEVLMKVLLLKTDPDRFIKEADRWEAYAHRGRLTPEEALA